MKSAHNSFVKIYCAFLIFGIILYCNFTVTLKLGVDFLNLKGYSAVYLSYIPIIKLFLCLSRVSGKFRLFAKIAGKTVYFNLTTDTDDENSVAKYVNNKYKINLDITSVEVYVNIGKKGDAMFSALLYSLCKSMIVSGMNYITNTQKAVLFYKGQIVDSNKLEFYMVASINLSLALVIKELISFYICKIKSEIKNNKIKKEKNQSDNGTKRQVFRAYDDKLV